VIDGVSVYEARLRMGEHLADKLLKHIPVGQIDVVIPIPDSSRPSAMQLAQRIGVPYREGFVKNRYIGRTFIMPGQATRALGSPEAEHRGAGIQGQARPAGR
jgi:amidophosphoribosyltransferase